MSGVKLTDLQLANPVQQAASPVTQQHVAPAGHVASQTKHVVSEISPATKPSDSVEENIQASRSDVKQAVAKLNDYVQSIQRDLTFDFDESTGKTIITVLDRKTKEVVRQIPDELALRLARNLQQDEPLSLFNMKV